MVARLQRRLSGGPVYVRLRKEWLSLRDAASGRVVEDAPVLALSRGAPRTVLAVGREAEREAAMRRVPYELVNGFDHPRVVIGDFLSAQKALGHLLQQLLPSRIIRASPVLVLHPLNELEGGISQIEVRALHELGAAVGASATHVWTGRELSDRALREGSFERDPALATGASRHETPA